VRDPCVGRLPKADSRPIARLPNARSDKHMAGEFAANPIAVERHFDAAAGGLANPHFAPRAGDALGDAGLNVTIELGRAQMPEHQALALRAGTVVRLDRAADDPVDVVVAGRLVARGQVVVVKGCFCVRVVELVATDAAGAAAAAA
jgi:flagellar motor switch protein FliN/FliY